MQQDAHEFLNYLLNTVADILQEEKKQEKQNGRLKNNGGTVAAETETENKTESTWVHDIFQGTLTNETRCLNCETVRASSLLVVLVLSVLLIGQQKKKKALERSWNHFFIYVYSRYKTCRFLHSSLFKRVDYTMESHRSAVKKTKSVKE